MARRRSARTCATFDRAKTRNGNSSRADERFRTVFDHAMEAIALLDPDGRVLELNAATRAAARHQHIG